MRLDYARFRIFLNRYFAGNADVAARRAGIDRQYDSGYGSIVRFYGPGAVDPSTVAIEYRGEPCRVGDPLVAAFAARVENELRAEERLYHGPQIAAVAESNLRCPPYRLVLQPCDYGLFAGCCFALDQPDSMFAAYGGTLRDYAFAHHTALPQCLGVCGLLAANESDGSRHILVVSRAGHLASLAGSIGPSTAGSVDFTEGWTTLEEVIRRAMEAEAEEELGLPPSEYTITPLAWADELFRGGKPQVFCRIDTPMTPDDVTARLRNVGGRPEFTAFEFLRVGPDGRLDSVHIARLNHEAAMNYYLFEESAFRA